MTVIYVFITSKNPFSFHCLQVVTAQDETEVQSDFLKFQSTLALGAFLTHFACRRSRKMISSPFIPGLSNPIRSPFAIETHAIIEIEFMVELPETVETIRTALKQKYPKIKDAEAFPRSGTLTLNHGDTARIKIVPDTAISEIFTHTSISFASTSPHEPLFPARLLTSDQIKQTLLGECAFAAIITGFCVDRAYRIYNCMRDNNDGSVLVSFYSENPTDEERKRYYLIQKTKFRSNTSGTLLTEHALWAHMLLKAYAIHCIHSRTEAQLAAIAPTPPTTPSIEPPRLDLLTFLQEINYIHLSHALTGGENVDFFGRPDKLYDNLVTEAGTKYPLESGADRQVYLLISDIKRLCCPVYVSARRAHFGNAVTKTVKHKTIHASHAYCVAKTQTGKITVFNPWQVITTSASSPVHVHHIRHSVRFGNPPQSSSSSSAHSISIIPTDFLASDAETEPLNTLYDADTETYSGAVTLKPTDFLSAFNSVRACKRETLWDSIKNEVVKILQAYIQFSGYDIGLAAVLQMVFLNHLPETFDLESLLEVIEKLYHVSRSLPQYPWLTENPILSLTKALNSFLPSSRQFAGLALPSSQLTTIADFTQPYQCEFSFVHTQMNRFYDPYRRLFHIIYAQANWEYETPGATAHICGIFNNILDGITEHLNMQMYGETLLTYSLTNIQRYQTENVIYSFIEEILRRRPSPIKKNIQGKSPLILLFENAFELFNLQRYQSITRLLRIAISLITLLTREHNTHIVQAELQSIADYLNSIPSPYKDYFRMIYENIMTQQRAELEQTESYARDTLTKLLEIQHANSVVRSAILTEEAIAYQKLTKSFRTFPHQLLSASLNSAPFDGILNQTIQIINAIRLNEGGHIQAVKSHHMYMGHLQRLQTDPHLTQNIVDQIFSEMDKDVNTILQSKFIIPTNKIQVKRNYEILKQHLLKLYQQTFA